MKKLILIIMLFAFSFSIINVKADNEIIPKAKAGILIEVSTGKIIYDKNIHEQMPVASMTKMMAQILILEEIEKGNLKWDEKIKVSANAANYGGSQIYLMPGEVMSVKDLFKGISIVSGNDATVALAEKIGGSENNFVIKMNKKAQALGLQNTVFKNCTGLDEEGHLSTAYDMSIIAKELLKHDDILKFSSIYEDYLRTNTPNKFWLVNTNKLIRFYEGADGLKTGHTDNAMYCMAATAKRNGMRLLAVTLGEPTAAIRNDETTKLLDYGFNLYRTKTLYKKEDIVKKITIDKSDPLIIKISPLSDVTILFKNEDSDKKYETEINLDNINLPLKKNDKVGEIIVKDNDYIINKIDLIVKEDIKKANIFNLYFRILGDII
ncbi:MAG: D-alanyl-D-alanine carboxypeptidase family protein, partial [Bacilli bacterium]